MNNSDVLQMAQEQILSYLNENDKNALNEHCANTLIMVKEDLSLLETMPDYFLVAIFPLINFKGEDLWRKWAKEENMASPSSINEIKTFFSVRNDEKSFIQQIAEENFEHFFIALVNLFVLKEDYINE